MSGSTSDMPVNVSRIGQFYYCFILYMHVRGAVKASRVVQDSIIPSNLIFPLILTAQ